ncbi:zinc finger domain-containing protein [Apiospora saccharicola]|uniref:Zinc finger domain-containing protein n=1 Tax=Apiospora saccharicola TaxID=335842 RepID=A0ABR1W590_9PEZI
MIDQKTENQVFNHESLSTQPYRRIGQGFCGSVWSCPQAPSATGDSSATTAIKREDGGPGRSLRNDYDMHQLVLRSLDQCPEELRMFTVPQCHAFIPPSHSGWDDGRVLGRFPAGYTSCNVLISERIPPMPEPIRNLLVDKFCPKNPESLPAQIRADEQNQDCLVRPYLGRTKHGRGRSRISFFSLRNFPLHLDQMLELGLSSPLVRDYAADMAKALAFLHWGAGIDANDVEFVLAPPLLPSSYSSSNHGDQPTHHETGGVFTFSSPVLVTHCLWILDFDCCRAMGRDEVGIEQAARAFLRNDPFYPRPGRLDDEEKELWQHFRSTFLEASDRIISKDTEGNGILRDLPRKLMDIIEELVAAKNA